MHPVLPSTGFFAQGPIDNGPCPRPLTNCVEFAITGSFTFVGSVGGLPVGFKPVLTIAVASGSPQGPSAGTRSQPCAPVNAAGITGCAGVVAEPTIFPHLGGPVTIAAPPATPTATSSPAASLPLIVAAAPPPLLPPPLQFLRAPPAPLLPPPPAPPMAAPQATDASVGVPIIPEADSAFLVIGGLAALGGLVGLRSLRRRRDGRV
jgi:hypothetical protein